mmetsp:Transcript_74490/g.125501  ORF Transcript_74490/g.125501 Transcript_74490/m.125501 type:complete len:81 (-) Transcript_74490:497-739(-)
MGMLQHNDVCAGTRLGLKFLRQLDLNRAPADRQPPLQVLAGYWRLTTNWLSAGPPTKPTHTKQKYCMSRLDLCTRDCAQN